MLRIIHNAVVTGQKEQKVNRSGFGVQFFGGWLGLVSFWNEVHAAIRWVSRSGRQTCGQ